MKTISHRWATFLTGGAMCMLVASLATFETDPKKFSADILTAEESDFYLWYIEDSLGSQQWDIPTQIGSIVELPLGLTVNGNITDALPIDSVEFRIGGVPDYLEFDSVSVFSGFHADGVLETSDTMGKTDLSVFVTPEFFADNAEGVPGAPVDQNEIGQLMSATPEVLRVKFRIVSAVHATSPLSVEGVLTTRDGEFTRYTADGNQNFPGDNPGAIEIVPNTEGSSLQIVSTKAVSDTEVQIEFTAPVLLGTGSNGSENPYNYFVYACGTHVPAPLNSDPNATDVQACQLKQQESILDPGESVAAMRDGQYSYMVRVSIDAADSFQEDAHYIVLVENVANDTAEISISADGIYSQMFQWKAHPLVQNVTEASLDTISVQFAAGVCPANSPTGAVDAQNYSVFACNQGTILSNCTVVNIGTAPDPTVVSATLGANNTVNLTLTNYVSGANYVVQVKNVSNESCDADSAVPIYPAYYSPMLAGSGGGTTHPSAGNMALGLGVGAVHLPWRETLPLKTYGGTAPYTWVVIPSEAGEIDVTNPSTPVFRPALVDGTGNPIHDERDVILRVTDADSNQSDIAVHILRRGDLGGTAPLFLDKTNVQDVNDVSAGWSS